MESSLKGKSGNKLNKYVYISKLSMHILHNVDTHSGWFTIKFLFNMQMHLLREVSNVYLFVSFK